MMASSKGKSKGKSMCTVCNREMGSGSMAAHLRGKQHLAKAAALSSKQPNVPAAAVPAAAAELGNSGDSLPKVWTCTTCNSRMPISCRETHIQGRQHMKNLTTAVPPTSELKPPSSKAEYWTCTICDRRVPPGSQESHLKGKPHRKRAARATVATTIELPTPGALSASASSSKVLHTSGINDTHSILEDISDENALSSVPSSPAKGKNKAPTPSLAISTPSASSSTLTGTANIDPVSTLPGTWNEARLRIQERLAHQQDWLRRLEETVKSNAINTQLQLQHINEKLKLQGDALSALTGRSNTVEEPTEVTPLVGALVGQMGQLIGVVRKLQETEGDVGERPLKRLNINGVAVSVPNVVDQPSNFSMPTDSLGPVENHSPLGIPVTHRSSSVPVGRRKRRRPRSVQGDGGSGDTQEAGPSVTNSLIDLD